MSSILVTLLPRWCPDLILFFIFASVCLFLLPAPVSQRVSKSDNYSTEQQLLLENVNESLF